MTNRIVWHIVACVTAFTLLPTSSRAQSPAITFNELRLLLKDGNEVVVTESNGRRTRGHVATVTASSIDLTLEKRKSLIRREYFQRSFTDTAVTAVTRVDSRWQGGIIGFVAGYVPVAVSLCRSADAGTPLACMGGLMFAGPAAGGVGLLIGALIDQSFNKVVYRAEAPVRRVTITVSPSPKPKSAGASLRLGF